MTAETKEADKRKSYLIWKIIRALPFLGGETGLDALVRDEQGEETKRTDGRVELYVHALGTRT